MREPKLHEVEDTHVRSSRDIAELVEQMGSSGGFMGKNVAESAEVVREMVEDPACTKLLSFPAALTATGLRGVLIDMVKNNMVDAIVTASGTIDHDIARTLGNYYLGSFMMDDAKLLKEGFHRLGNILVPTSDYGSTIEKWTQPMLDELYGSGKKSIAPFELAEEVGKRLGSEKSLLCWAHRKKVPVFVPGITDGAFGSQLWLFREKHRDFNVDVLADEKRLADLVLESRRTGALVIGGGISKHHLIWWAQFKGGLDYACYITTAVEWDGSLSGAQVREAVSWGKVKVKAKKVTLYADATTVLPLIVVYAVTKHSQ
jgi:deoxyhypusine synthase